MTNHEKVITTGKNKRSLRRVIKLKLLLTTLEKTEEIIIKLGRRRRGGGAVP